MFRLGCVPKHVTPASFGVPTAAVSDIFGIVTRLGSEMVLGSLSGILLLFVRHCFASFIVSIITPWTCSSSFIKEIFATGMAHSGTARYFNGKICLIKRAENDAPIRMTMESPSLTSKHSREILLHTFTFKGINSFYCNACPRADLSDDGFIVVLTVLPHLGGRKYAQLSYSLSPVSNRAVTKLVVRQ